MLGGYLCLSVSVRRVSCVVLFVYRLVCRSLLLSDCQRGIADRAVAGVARTYCGAVLFFCHARCYLGWIISRFI
jgi:hypothetical protein